MAFSPAKAKYSYKWARSVVDKWYSSMGRVANLFEENIGLSRNQLAYLLASGRYEWPIIRDCGKQFVTYVQKQRSLDLITPTLVKYCFLTAVQSVEKRAEDTLRGYLQGLETSVSCESR